MSLRKNFEMNSDLEREGVWFEIGVYDEESDKPTIMRVKLARMGKGNPDYIKMVETETKPHQAAIRAGTMPEKLSARIMHKVVGTTVVKAWENIRKSEWTGNAEDTDFQKYTPEKAIELFTIMPDLYEDWKEKASAATYYRRDQLEASAGN